MEAIDINKAIYAEFENDLKGMSPDEIEAERQEVQDRVDRETEWLEALCAAQYLQRVSEKEHTS